MEFHQRLTRSAGNSPQIPEYGMGRQTFIAKELGVSQEAVRKWFAGESKPRSAAMAKLATLLDVELVWLSLGVDHSETNSNRVMARRQDAGMYALTSYLIYSGYNVAFTFDESDNSDLTAMRNGQITKFRTHSVEQTTGAIEALSAPTSSIVDVACVINTNLGFGIEFLDISNLMGTGSLQLKAPSKTGIYKIGKDVVKQLQL